GEEARHARAAPVGQAPGDHHIDRSRLGTARVGAPATPRLALATTGPVDARGAGDPARRHTGARQTGRAVTAVADTAIPTQDSPTRERGGIFRSLRVRNYRLYASGQLVSLTGTWMQRVAQDWLVLTLTNSGTALGFVTALQFGPSLLLGLWG